LNQNEILQILQVSQFEKTALISLLSESELQIEEKGDEKQLSLALF